MRLLPASPRRSRPGRAARLTAALAGAALLTAAAAAPAAAAPGRSTRVLVKVQPGAGAGERAEITRQLGARRSEPLAAGWLAYDLPASVSEAEARAALADAGAAGPVELDLPVMHVDALPTDPLLRQQWTLDRVQAPVAWGLPAGAPVTVAVVDTGVDLSHPDLAPSAWRNPREIAGNGVDDDGNGYTDDVNGWDFLHGDSTVYDGEASDLHGTHVAGIVAAAWDGAGTAGIAPNARIMALKFVDGSGGTASNAIAAIRYARANGARIVNASFGGPYSQALCDAVAEAAAAGVLVVAAAGNESSSVDAALRAPAACPEPSVISVAASDGTDALAPFSNFGVRTIDLAAPGEAVLSTVPGRTHDVWSGTSMATPHVAGAAALMLGARPLMSPLAVRDAILSGTDPVPGLSGRVATGGRLNVARALGLTPSDVPLVSTSDAVPVSAPQSAPAAARRARVLRLEASRRRIRAGVATRLRYRVSADARVRFIVRDAATGAVAATFVREGVRGDNVLYLTARAGRARPLPPGRYRVAARTGSETTATIAITLEVLPAPGETPAEPPTP